MQMDTRKEISFYIILLSMKKKKTLLKLSGYNLKYDM